MTDKKAVAKKVIANILYPVAAFAAVLGMWAIVAAVKALPLGFPSVGEIFRALGQLLGSGAKWLAIGNTLGRIIAAFLLSAAFGVALAVLGQAWLPVRKFMRPVVTVLQSAPTMAVILLAVVWLDDSEVPLLVGFLVCFPLLYNTCCDALDSVDGELLEMAKVYGVRKRDRLTGIYIPTMFPVFVDGSRSAVSLCVKVVIAAEVLAQTTRSIGVEMQRESVMFEIADLLAWTVVAIVLSFLMEGLVTLVGTLWEKRR